MTDLDPDERGELLRTLDQLADAGMLDRPHAHELRRRLAELERKESPCTSTSN